jgi:acetylornithine deacetylase/succinyl-diaminopimelate desuccinylase-like protein
MIPGEMMTEYRTAALQYAQDQRASFLEDLKTFVRIPSISTDPDSKAEMRRAAEWVAQELRKLGMNHVAIYPTNGHPVVYGDLLNAGPDKPTVLLYGHYDVQPVEPLELWQSPPFEPEQRGENLYGRGASDMKGQVIASMKAIEALVHNGGFPVNLKYIIEGEEEIGSTSLEGFIATHKELLASDFAFNPDAGMIAKDTPTITYGLRGLAYFELRVYGPDHDLHSGQFGGVVHNPAQVLCELIAGMHDENGQITLPGYYDSVLPISKEEHAEFTRQPTDEAYYLKQTGAPALFGEAGYIPVERIGARPTLEVNGLLSGFTGEGSKTVLPAMAMAKISMRLVPNQRPEEVHRQMLQYLEAHAPATVRYEVKDVNSGLPSITNREMPAVSALDQAMESVFGKRPVYRREGGSIPVTAQISDILGIDSVLTGFGLPDDNLHAPNEKIHLPTFYQGIDTLIHFFCNL